MKLQSSNAARKVALKLVTRLYTHVRQCTANFLHGAWIISAAVLTSMSVGLFVEHKHGILDLETEKSLHE
jgi:hypothetical protein